MQKRNKTSTPIRSHFGAGYMNASLSPINDVPTPDRQMWRPICSPQSQSMSSPRDEALQATPDSKVFDCPGSAECSPESSAKTTASPSIYSTPAIHRRNAPIRRFACKRQLDMNDAEEMDGRVPADLPISDEVAEALQMISFMDHNADGNRRKDLGQALVQGPNTSHTYVPLWVMHCYDDAPEMFDWAMAYYFKKVKWPTEDLIPMWYRDDLKRDRIHLDAYQTTCGFAPVWMFLLNNMVKAGQMEKDIFDRCVDMFFQDDEWPAIAALPDEFQDECERNRIDDYTYFDTNS